MPRYTVLLTPEPDEGGYSVRVPALPGLHTQGDSYREAVENARSAIKFHLDCLAAEGEPIPEQMEEPTLVRVDI
ncbi:MAG: type II toxin-antitoxin system HicB family antitoxin [Chloroflexota bacterium]|nr:type II toxin-antitoxin system HicB family antitoxin [Chloroflexota bacterium]